jgi:hypothetical protein
MYAESTLKNFLDKMDIIRPQNSHQWSLFDISDGKLAVRGLEKLHKDHHSPKGLVWDLVIYETIPMRDETLRISANNGRG